MKKTVDLVDELDINLEITEEAQSKEKPEMIDPLDVLVNHDFSTDMDYNECVEILDILDKDMITAKNNEALDTIAKLSIEYVEPKYLTELNNSLENIRKMIKRYDVNSDFVKNMTEVEKNNIFKIAKFLMKNLNLKVNEINYSLTLTRDEYKFLSHVLEHKTKYDGNDVLNAADVNIYLKKWKEIDKMIPKQEPSFNVSIDIRSLITIYHFINRYSVTGTEKDFYTFSDILNKMNDANRVFTSYNVLKENLNTEIMIWTSAIDEAKKEEITNN